MGSSPYHYRLRATTFGHPKTLDEYLPLRVSGVTFCAKTEDLPAWFSATTAGNAISLTDKPTRPGHWPRRAGGEYQRIEKGCEARPAAHRLTALASTMAQKSSPCLTTVQPQPGAGGPCGDFLHNQTAGLNRFAQRRGGG
ncbi:hypothetical protein CWN07_19605 [Klebsiella quasipneumoniae]|uniref:hypothetical protein n=1 Tax=Klebsiella quasipneumoniae TaxID=1463165 RepID=UPI000C7CC9A2|nr:hypothetical protein [Klebsiella quasipneumoniae]EKV4331028.1 hypothetical protein [Klebsiella quasipneumoniae]PLN00476.1 hypothetical protein CWN07_19605 [Klebsiella quasipneumoniae]PLO89189.1 hypothetical protein CWN03_10740 [Klebsiella quasipneumoniae]